MHGCKRAANIKQVNSELWVVKPYVESETRDLVAHIALFIGKGFFRTRETRLYKTKRVHRKETGTAIDAHTPGDGRTPLDSCGHTHARARGSRRTHLAHTHKLKRPRAIVVVFSILDLVIAKHWTYTPHSKNKVCLIRSGAVIGFQKKLHRQKNKYPATAEGL